MGPDFEMEKAAYAAGMLHVAGVDEVGRGPLAGPVTAAAVVLDPLLIPEGLNDSKQLSKKRREALAELLAGCAMVSIEQVNMLPASHRAMQRAVGGLPVVPDQVLVDGAIVPHGMNLPVIPVVKGDTRCLSISAASIVAKIARDRIMVDLAQQHPGYGWETNMGYGSKSHMAALRNLGVTPHHRRTFKPVHKMLYQEKIVSS